MRMATHRRKVGSLTPPMMAQGPPVAVLSRRPGPAYRTVRAAQGRSARPRYWARYRDARPPVTH
eukprot:63495-Hanusia_phi.AAC.1